MAMESAHAPRRYRGRFAPSPTGPLHFGSLVAALGSWLDARAARGEWLLRIEDLDRARAQPGAADAILRALDAVGLAHDGAVEWQSRRMPLYREAMARLRADGACFACACSRREVADSWTRQRPAPAGKGDGDPGGDPVYPGTCRGGLPPGREARAWRLRVGDARIGFEDRVQGRVDQSLAREVGDFVLLRADGFVAYQLAVVVDDADQGITDVVRGADLLGSTARQELLQRRLGCVPLRYAHLPVAVNAAGEKLSKQTLAPALDPDRAAATVQAALDFLGHAPPADLRGAPVRELLDWGAANWDMARVPRVAQLAAPQ
jgi:glutamyl-Q tRNA(Asp) synthetase